jgi:hypothetical protein
MLTTPSLSGLEFMVRQLDAMVHKDKLNQWNVNL